MLTPIRKAGSGTLDDLRNHILRLRRQDRVAVKAGGQTPPVLVAGSPTSTKGARALRSQELKNEHRD